MTRLTLIIALIAISVQNQAQALVCGPRTDITAHLEAKFGEIPQGITVMDETFVFELWTSEETGSWTVLQTRVDGISCLVDAGKGWGIRS